MAPRKRSKISYEQHAADSGYMTDLVQAAQRDNDAATAFFASSSSGPQTGHMLRTVPSARSASPLYSSFSMSSFEDTQWDIPAKDLTKHESLERSCKELAACVKEPTRFPIIPLESTLRRARQETEAERLGKNTNQRKSVRNKNIQKTRRFAKVAARAYVDSRDRTRAASRLNAAAESARNIVPSESYDPPTRRSGRVQGHALAPSLVRYQTLRASY